MALSYCGSPLFLFSLSLSLFSFTPVDVNFLPLNSWYRRRSSVIVPIECGKSNGQP
ncbi:hypothetical protein BDV26DRAFT_253709 [Aspergillus bertholletiae]|uniref:Uncharacterized protein n=1 Tax=Aspergillus bertholletiae TaxID=1226010 RepID=A0A5N7BKH6_9EURO|nr:hypothetical protein BDV26DRAFT_253709 [Aspergillus bertholletiae]